MQLSDNNNLHVLEHETGKEIRTCNAIVQTLLRGFAALLRFVRHGMIHFVYRIPSYLQ